MTVPSRSSTDRKTCSHVVEGWWGNERAALCTPPWSVLREALLVEHVDVAYVVVVGASSGAKRNGTRSPLEECSNSIPFTQIVESFEALKEEPIVTPSPPPKYKLIIDENENENATLLTTEKEADTIENESFESDSLSEDDREEETEPVDLMQTSPTIRLDDLIEPEGPLEASPTNEAPTPPRFRLLIGLKNRLHFTFATESLHERTRHGQFFCGQVLRGTTTGAGFGSLYLTEFMYIQAQHFDALHHIGDIVFFIL
jgi:hypothetical protein